MKEPPGVPDGPKTGARHCELVDEDQRKFTVCRCRPTTTHERSRGEQQGGWATFLSVMKSAEVMEAQRAVNQEREARPAP
jgi:hypothetical protein